MIDVISMGCISSKADINDQHPNIFNVKNRDEGGTPISQGQLEITETDLIFYERGKSPKRWPLRSLRRYGFEAEIFSFEAGRRCPSGAGIYAFQCSRAEALFNLLQTNIQQSRSSGGDDTISRELTIATPTSTQGSLLPSSIPRGSLASSGTLVDSPLEPNYLEPVRTSRSINLRQMNGSLARLSGGPLSPQTPSPCSVLPSPGSSSVYYCNDIIIPTIDESVINNNLIRTMTNITVTTSTTVNVDNPTVTTCPNTVITSQSNGDIVNIASNVNTTPGTPTSPISYMNLLSPTTPCQPYDTETNYARLDALLRSEQLHLYMNVEPENIKDKELIELPTSQSSNNIDSDRHCYANLGIGPGEIELKPRTVLLPHPTPVPLLPVETPPAEHKSSIRQVNYIVLDLDRGSDTVGSSQSTPLSPVGSTSSAALLDSPRASSTNSVGYGYATIDFNKTAALSISVNSNVELENEGPRKTRHNSKIHELPVKQNSSSISD